jgi:hypothetical protein
MAKKTKHVHINVTSNVSGVSKKATASSDKLGGSLKKTKGQASGMSGAFGALGAKLKKFGKHPAAIAVAALALIGKGLLSAMRVAEGFSKSMSKLSAISGATGDDLKALNANAQELGKSTQFTAAQVADAQTELAKMGFTTTGILNATSGALDLAVSSGVEMAEAAEIMAATMNGFGMSTSEASRITDVMAKSFVTSALDAEKFRESMKLVAPTAKTTKVSLEQTTAALAVLANQGIAGSMAGTSLRRTLMELSAKTGKDFRTSLDIYADRLQNATSTSEKLGIATEAVGVRSAGVLISLTENRDKLDELTLSYENAAGAAGDMVNTMEDNLSGDKKKMKSALEGLGIAVSNTLGLEKAMRGIVSVVTTSATTFTNFFTTIGNKLKLAGVDFKLLGTRIQIFFQEFGLSANGLMEKISDVPILGRAIDKDTIAINKAAYKETIGDLEKELDGLSERQRELRTVINEVYNPSGDKESLTGDEAPATGGGSDDYVTGDGEDDGSEDAKIQRLKDFLTKQRQAVQDFEDETHLQKMERTLNRAMQEAEALGATKEQLLELELSYYDRLEAARQKDVDAAKKLREEENEDKRNQMMDNLDTMSRVFGEETRLGKLALIAKQQMSKIEMDMDGKLTASKMVKAMAEGAVDYVKGISKAASAAPFPANVPLIAGHIATALPLFMQLKKAFKSSKSSAGISAPSIGGGASGATAVTAPSFNVVGQADAGSQMVADAIQGSNSKPIKAFVVSGEVSSQQELERKAGSTASIG